MADINGKNTLKHKMHVMQAEAASISVAIHVLFIVLAGSIVAVRWINKEAAEFAGENIDRPKLERRQLQMPVKVKNMQKKSRRPQVKTRMSAAAKTSFELPNMSSMGLGLNGFGDDYDGGAGRRDLSGLGGAGSLGFGISGVNFFGIKSKGEKLLFIVDASKDMLLDKKGGYYTYQYVKDKIREMVDGMKAATLFNVMVYDNKGNTSSVYMFQQQMVPATEANRDALKKWFDPINKNPRSVGEVKKLANYQPRFEYDSLVGPDAMEWAGAVQAAMEQTPDNIFILSSEWGQHVIPKEKRETMFNIDYDDQKEWLASQGWNEERLKEHKRQSDAIRDKTKKALEKENKRRAAQGLPPKFIHHWHSYAKELGWEWPKNPPQMHERWHFNEDEIMEHLKAVSLFNYKPKKLRNPLVHFVYLVASDYQTHANEKEAENVSRLRSVTKAFRGRFEFLHGAKTMENLLALNAGLEE
ncbi:MAG: hypothetical protein K9M45_10900 [Kiritimatiellales bacterium]|nr:hypothetical protein [Kiritimatiellales bacterium]